MKNTYPYIIGGVVLLFFVVLLLGSKGRPAQQRRMDERITLRHQDKIPYGTAVAKELLPSLFPTASVQDDARYPGSWDGINAYDSNQAVILIADYLDADTDELNELRSFAAHGNSVFVIARSFSDATANFFNLTFNNYYDLFAGSQQDSLRIQLQAPVFSTDTVFFTYPGRRYEGSIRKFDSARTTVLGRNEGGWADFIGMKKGSGNIYLHTAPLAFSNYFILHKQNATYYQAALSVLPKGVKTVLWNEYFLQKISTPKEGDNDVNWLGALMKQPAFKWGFLTALATLILYVLLGMRRKQRIIPPYEKPKNDSLDFVKTLGRLYYDGSDHKNLAGKMSAYFLEHVRSKYKIATHTLDDEFVKSLQAKSGYPEEELKQLINEIKQVQNLPNISEENLAGFYKRLELFYQNT